MSEAPSSIKRVAVRRVQHRDQSRRRYDTKNDRQELHMVIIGHGWSRKHHWGALHFSGRPRPRSCGRSNYMCCRCHPTLKAMEAKYLLVKLMASSANLTISFPAQLLVVPWTPISQAVLSISEVSAPVRVARRMCEMGLRWNDQVLKSLAR